MTAIAAFVAANMAPVMFVALVAFLLLGYPVAFALAACGLAFFALGVVLTPLSGGALHLAWPMLQTLPERMLGIVDSDTLLAIPYFTFLGMILQRSGLAEDLLDTIGHLFGTVRGGLAYAVIAVGTLLAATSGVVAASVISMGLISLPAMLRAGYDRRLATGVIAASGTLAQIIPPALVLIVLAEQLQRPVGDMFAAAFVPGILLSAFYAVYVFVVSRLAPGRAPGLAPDAVAYIEPEGSVQFRLAMIGGLSMVAATLIGLVLAWPHLSAVLRSRDAVAIVATVAALAVALAFLVTGARAFRSGRDRRGLCSLAGVVAIATVAGFAITRHIATGEASVVPAIAASLALALALAVGGWAIEQATGQRVVSRLTQRTAVALMPPLFLIFVVLGSIFLGLATPQEAGALGVCGALALAALRRKLEDDPSRCNLAMIRDALEAAAKLTAFAMFILVGTRIFSLTFFAAGGQRWVEHLLTSLPGGRLGFLVATNALIFVLAFFLEFFELAFIVIPLLIAPAEALGIDIVWLGVMLAVNMQTSFLHPPFGYALFYLRSVTPAEPFRDAVSGRTIAGVATADIYWGAIPFVLIQCLMVALVVAFPKLVGQ